MTIDHRGRACAGRLLQVALVAALLSLAAIVMVAAPARADFGVSLFDGQVSADSAGDPYTQAAGHPYQASTAIRFSETLDSMDRVVADGNVRDVKVDLPPGFVANPTAMPRCPEVLLETNRCPARAQVGYATVDLAQGNNPLSSVYTVALFNMVPRQGKPAELGFNVAGNAVVKLVPRVRPGDFGLSIDSLRTSQSLGLVGAEVVVWGVPADPVHDRLRTDGSGTILCFGGAMGGPGRPGSLCLSEFNPQPAGVQSRAFVTNPSNCAAGPLETRLTVDSWQNPGVTQQANFISHLPPAYPVEMDPSSWGAPQGVTGCDQVPFEPDVAIEPTSTVADGPTGLEAVLSFGHSSTPTDLASSPLKRARVTLPEGMSINPAAADGLVACGNADLRLDSDRPASCPVDSRIGSASATTPLLERFAPTGEALLGTDGKPLPDPLSGGVYVRSQASGDPASGDMFRIALVLENAERGLSIKLPGKVSADPRTGRLIATFDNNPQLPVDEVKVSLRSGPRAPLALPADCGVKTIETELTSWSGAVETFADQFTVPCPGGVGFEPGFAAGATNPIAASFSPFLARIQRSERDGFLSGVSVDLPKGLLAKLRGVELCPDAVAGDGTPGVCPAGSRVAGATVGAGSGNPFYLSGDVYLTGPYKGAPYGLSVQVPAKAGPFDLGMVKVRQRIEVDPETAEISVVSDALPQVVQGVVARLRDVRVGVDRPSFAINPTSCAAKRVEATLTSIAGQARAVGQRFQVADCASLAFKPRMAMRLTGKRQTRTGGHPALTTTLTQGSGQANIAKAKVTLPKSIVLDPNNSVDPKMLCDYDASLKADCPQSTVIGTATAVTPVLNRPLTGQVHMVQGIRIDPKTKNRIRTTPSLLVKLRGEVAINLRGQTTTDKNTNQLVTTFAAVPDAPVSRFSLKVNGGKKGILVVTRTRRAKINLCAGGQTANIETDGQNGKRADYRTQVKTPCAKRRR